MNASTFRISLDVHRQTTQAHLAVKKGDTARTIIASLSDGGKPYKIEDGCSATFMAQKPDGNVLYNACRIENNRIVYDFTEQTVSAAGRVIGELRLYGADEKLITSPRIAITVSGTVYDDDEVESTSEFTALSQAMTDIAELKKNGLKGDPGDSVELRYFEQEVQWRRAVPEGEPEDEWKALFSSDEVRDQVVQETLDEANSAAASAEQSSVQAAASASRAEDCVLQAQEFEQDAYYEAEDARRYAEQAAAAVAAMPKALPNPHKLTITGAVEAEYDGSGEVKVEIPEGGVKEIHIGPEPPTNGEAIWINPDEEPEGGGAVSPEAIKQAVDAYMAENPVEVGDCITPPATASVGQTIVVKAVDENGKPTEWEAADLPSGGGAGWEIIADITTTEEVDAVAITTDADGNAFELSDAAISVAIVGTENNTTEASLGIAINAKGNSGVRNAAA